MTFYPPWECYQSWITTEPALLTAAADRFPAILSGALNWPTDCSVLPAKPVDLLLALGVQTGDYVVLPALCPAYWAEAIHQLGADPIFVDVKTTHWQLDLDLLEEFLMNYTVLSETDELILKKDDRPIRCLLLPHVLGVIPDMKRVQFIARRFHLNVGEDITQAIGSTRSDKAAGTFGQAAFLAFNENSLLPFGHSMLLTTDQKIGDLPITDSPTVKTTLLNGLGEQIVRHWPEILRQSQTQATHYREQLSDLPTLQWIELPDNYRSNGQAIAFVTSTALANHLRTADVPTARLPQPLNQLPAYTSALYIRRDDQANRLYEQGLVLPQGLHLVPEDIAYIIETIRAYLGKHPK